MWLRCQIILSNKSIFFASFSAFCFHIFYKYLMETQGKVNDQQALVLLMMCLPLSLAVGSPITIILSEEKRKVQFTNLFC